MKKIIKLIFIAILTMSLVGCNSKTVDEQPLTIISATGAPSLAFYNYVDSTAFQTNSVPKNILAMMAGEDGADIIVVDAVSGISAIKNGANYKLAAILTFGNFYIGATGNDEDGILNVGDKLVLFGQNQTPDLVFHHLFGNEFDEQISYVNAVSDAAAVLKTGLDLEGEEQDYVFVAQPVLATVLKANDKVSVYADIQELYQSKNGSSLIQAAVFVKNSVTEKQSEKFLTDLQSDIEALIEEPELLVAAYEKVGEEEAKVKFGVAASVAVAALQDNSLGLGFKKAIDIKADIDTFLGIMNKPLTDEEIYRN